MLTLIQFYNKFKTKLKNDTEVGIQYYKSIIALTVELLMRDKIHIDEIRENKINELLNKDDKV